MAKIQIKSETIASFGGIFHVMNIFERSGLKNLIDLTLGERNSAPNAYPYSSIIGSLYYALLSGADCLEDINELASQFDMRPGTKTPNADTVGRVLKSLASESELIKCEDSQMVYKIDKAEILNELLLKSVKLLGLIKSGQKVTLDFDHQFIPAHKFDAHYSYKGDYGYFPGWATIDGIFVGGENRDGNTNVKFHQAECLARIMDRISLILDVVIDKFRADCGSFSNEIIATVESRCTNFYIRANNCASRREEFDKYDGWKDVEINHEKCEVATFYHMINDKKYRLVVQRTPKKEDGKDVTDLFGRVYVYRAIITNDETTSEEDVILFYNKRGESERNFDIQNNDFGWKHLPFSFLEQNTVFMLVTAMLKNFYLYLIERLSTIVPGIKKTSRLKRFIFHFICVPAKWIRTGRQWVLRLYTTRTFYPLVFDS